MHFRSSCQYTHGCCAPASWATQHTTVCLDYYIYVHVRRYIALMSLYVATPYFSMLIIHFVSCNNYLPN